MAASRSGLFIAPGVCDVDNRDAKQRAKLVIAEIIRQAGGELHNKTNLYKAFYHAHLIYAESQPGYLSDWPIVKMPNGPGIGDADTLLGELIAEHVLRVQQVRKGNCFAFVFKLTEKAAPAERLKPAAAAAIYEAVKLVIGKTAARVSRESHNYSRAWREAELGEELNIYCDPIPEDEYRATQASMQQIAHALRAAWGESGGTFSDTKN